MKFLTPTFVKQSKPCLSADEWECWGPAEGPQLWKVQRTFYLSRESSWACSDQWDRDAVGDNYWGEYSCLGWAWLGFYFYRTCMARRRRCWSMSPRRRSTPGPRPWTGPRRWRPSSRFKKIMFSSLGPGIILLFIHSLFIYFHMKYILYIYLLFGSTQVWNI